MEVCARLRKVSKGFCKSSETFLTAYGHWDGCRTETPPGEGNRTAQPWPPRRCSPPEPALPRCARRPLAPPGRHRPGRQHCAATWACRARRRRIRRDRPGRRLQSRQMGCAKALEQVQRRRRGDLVVAHGAAVLELLARKDQALLVGRDALLVLDLRLHVLNRVRGLHLERDRLACRRKA